MTSKRIGAMQPYLFPYLGYFQLIAAVDAFVLSDDLQYINQGWINRNRILVNKQPALIQFPLKKASHLCRINERVLSDDFPQQRQRLLKTIVFAYGKAPCFDRFFPVLKGIIDFEERNLARYAENALRGICRYLDIGTPLLNSSDLALGPDFGIQGRVIETVRKLGGTVYINPIGGTGLYDFDTFERSGIELKFHRMEDVRYPQGRNAFVPSLSIIDVLMFNDVSEARRLLRCYSLNGREAFAGRLPAAARPPVAPVLRPLDQSASSGR